MALYEHIYLARQDVSPQQVEELTTTLTKVLTEGGGKVTKNEYWGLKSLSYRIRKNRKAHYSLLNIDAPATAVAEMERQMRINEDILRFMTIRVDELEEGPSAMMQKRDRDDDRGDRGRPSATAAASTAATAVPAGSKERSPMAIRDLTTSQARRPFQRRRKTCPFSGPNAPKIDYKDVRLLQPLRLRARQDRAVAASPPFRP